MSRIFPVAAVRKAEQDAVLAGIAEYTLMDRAGRQAADIINYHFKAAVRFVVLCGGGNNGGDALVAAAYLCQRYQREAVIYCVKPLNSLTGCAAAAVANLPENIKVINDIPAPGDIQPGDVIIDGLLGIGFNGGELRAGVRQMIEIANAVHCPVVALDVPSGINSDTGEVSPDGAINADMTITFGMLKAGLFSAAGSRLRGKLRMADIGLANYVSDSGEIFVNTDAVSAVLHPEFDCHKNRRGRVLVWGGSDEYPGAPVLAARAALHCGSGIVRLISNGECRSLAPASVIVRKLLNGSNIHSEVTPLFGVSDVLVAGCGWGTDNPAEALDVVQDFPGTVVLDADALNMFSCNIGKWRCRDKVIITPHPGEAARLASALGIIANGRSELCLKLAEKLHCTVLLKGRDSIVADFSGRKMLIAAGDHKLATAGSGDVLAGIIGAMAASGNAEFEAAVLGAYIHGVAGETAPGIPVADQLPELAGKVLAALRANGLF